MYLLVLLRILIYYYDIYLIYNIIILNLFIYQYQYLMDNFMIQDINILILVMM